MSAARSRSATPGHVPAAATTNNPTAATTPRCGAAGVAHAGTGCASPSQAAGAPGSTHPAGAPRSVRTAGGTPWGRTRVAVGDCCCHPPAGVTTVAGTSRRGGPTGAYVAGAVAGRAMVGADPAGAPSVGGAPPDSTIVASEAA